MNIRFLSYPIFLRHVELVSISHIFDNEWIINETLKQIQCDVRFMIDYEHSIFNIEKQ